MKCIEQPARHSSYSSTRRQSVLLFVFVRSTDKQTAAATKTRLYFKVHSKAAHKRYRKDALNHDEGEDEKRNKMESQSVRIQCVHSSFLSHLFQSFSSAFPISFVECVVDTTPTLKLPSYHSVCECCMHRK